MLAYFVSFKRSILTIKKTFMLNTSKVLSIKVKSVFSNPHIHCRVPCIAFHFIPCSSSAISTLIISLLKTKQQLLSIKLPSRTPIRHYLIFRSPTTHSTCSEMTIMISPEAGIPLLEVYLSKNFTKLII